MTQKDLTAQPDLTQHDTGTGAQRSRIPVYMDFLPPCNHACPAGEDIQAWLALAQEGLYEAAWQKLIENNPFPAIHGRVCYHPCETSCNRALTDQEVSIHAVERFLGDLALEKGWTPSFTAPPNGKKVLIIGAGPSGLSCAYHLKRLGHDVEVREAGPFAGGMIHFGIPAYRMPRNELNAEIKRVEDMGVKIVLNHRVEDVLAEKEAGCFDAVFIAVGAHLSKNIDIPGRDAAKIMDAVSFLKSVENGEELHMGRRVAIYGGGNTAMDAARTAKRLGATEAVIIYRRDRASMPAHDFEADEAIEEGVKINWLRTIKEIDATTFKVEVMELDDKGRPQPTGRYESLEVDSLIMAVGQDTDTAFLRQIPGIEFNRDDTVIVNNGMMTGADGIFAGGDMVPSERSVTIATGHGKKAARHIDAWLHGSTYQTADKHPIVGHESLHLWYRTEAPKKKQGELAPENRLGGFEEIMQGLTEQEAQFEARRCLSCGNCFECDGCYGSCPEDAIIKLGKGNRYQYNYDRCTGCATCYEQCPCHAIEMVIDTSAQTAKGGAA
ncbi:MAG: glutamate synthase [Zetaproteobacteria bacterium CG12_big_fil_rev_8_21_14_0_65_55_1124]|nr:MAG: glutamate synthase [Zetaproteobacteria bacterium CG1_02_55_237]PIS20360.1 MAG: glutamate synthase [Zetaproteobacteria bacterium CG08_land_8_20_14_0_20_55_17]PIW42415.1 MAG: glutamate synthase [Zetaproteobacteria bacterium CG12_big_fil_rev_8_21_14_0_65_55_1124]PIY52362.1 MAG: glutamate synthase [Zetaproteobacteria bacterium CG_4_10_14_0_8_um_filter_55_43]PIZ37141.1 MAG: glutamate synthase [Zetaproteobacteria bacterium CG_4_10_14_0_2_um_filter_55_20]PJB81771.1 MAG: glutamate synthase [Ze